MSVTGISAIDAQEKEPKTGWNLGPLPTISYNSDLGFQYGALCSFFYYGDGSTFPEYMHMFNVQASQFSKGTGMYHFFYDSKYLIPSSRLTFAATYLPNKKMDFRGFNGYSSPFDDSQPIEFYAIDRKMLRILADYQRKIGANLNVAAGLSFWNCNIGRVKTFNEPTLYDLYCGKEVIRPEEASGGSQVEMKLGLVYDTRDHEAAPFKGVWAEIIAYGSPDMIDKNNNAYLKLSTHFRHYVPMISNRLVFAYHLAYQGTLAGRTPYYMQQNITTLYLRQDNSEGLGGINTIRGVLYNSVVGDGLLWGNFELRYKLFNFRFLKQQWYAGINPFFDAGRVVQSYKLQEMKDAGDTMIYSGDDEKMHFGAGLGAKFVMNRNFIISAEFGKPFDSRDGKSGMNIGLNYIF
jgi:outer membrane protein assembly factor BamA